MLRGNSVTGKASPASLCPTETVLRLRFPNTVSLRVKADHTPPRGRSVPEAPGSRSALAGRRPRLPQAQPRVCAGALGASSGRRGQQPVTRQPPCPRRCRPCHTSPNPSAEACAQPGEPAGGKKHPPLHPYGAERKETTTEEMSELQTQQGWPFLTRELVFSHLVISESNQEDKRGC